MLVDAGLAGIRYFVVMNDKFVDIEEFDHP